VEIKNHETKYNIKILSVIMTYTYSRNVARCFQSVRLCEQPNGF